MVSAYNPTTYNMMIDSIETGFIKAGVDTASVVANRIMIERSAAHNLALASEAKNQSLAYTNVWGHSEGAAIMTQALLEGVSADVLKYVDARMFGSPAGVAPAGLHSFIGVGNINDSVATSLGRNFTFSGGVENSRGFIEGNLANPGSYKYVSTDFIVDTIAVGNSTSTIERNWNHSWQYYFSDPGTRSGFGLVPLNENLKGFYSNSYWLNRE